MEDLKFQMQDFLDQMQIDIKKFCLRFSLDSMLIYPKNMKDSKFHDLTKNEYCMLSVKVKY